MSNVKDKIDLLQQSYSGVKWLVGDVFSGANEDRQKRANQQVILADQFSQYEKANKGLDWLMGDDFAALKKKGASKGAPEVFHARNIRNTEQAKAKRGEGNTGLKVVRGGNQAMVKFIRKGGTNTAKGMRSQMNYLSRDGDVTVKTSARSFEVEMTDEDKKDLIDQWDSEGSSGGFDKTSHFVVSFPAGTDTDAAERAGRAWADEMFNSGNYGDVYDYYTAAHNDTNYPHVHVIVNRRGLENGEWLKVSKRGPIDYEVIREVQVKVAREEGIELSSTPRAARGIVERPATSEEVRRARREERSVSPRPHDEQSALKTAVNVLYHAAGMEREADNIDKQYPQLSQDLKDASADLKEGQQATTSSETNVINFDEARRLNEQITDQRIGEIRRLRSAEERLEKLPEGSLKRIQGERLLCDIKTDNSDHYNKYGYEEHKVDENQSYRGIGKGDDYSNNIKHIANASVKKIAERAGLDGDAIVAKYDSSKPVTQELAEQWRREEQSQLNHKENGAGLIDDAHRQINNVYDKARQDIQVYHRTKNEIVQDLANPQKKLGKDINFDTYQRVSKIITPEQKQALEQGDVTQLSHITKDAEQQHELGKQYLLGSGYEKSVEEQTAVKEKAQAVNYRLQRLRTERMRQEQQRQGLDKDDNSFSR